MSNVTDKWPLTHERFSEEWAESSLAQTKPSTTLRNVAALLRCQLVFALKSLTYLRPPCALSQ
ncbi:hypothetical protein BD309DRAFT_992892 [Dichomitus squalens]|uniref:Uncharacterized protein n=1 Tax=Dichomitus squalens TaxID=114155 RepID=A0A4Q9PF43_9APHY|nr:uncharacterized protein DICSQDRAFT_143000 [Dichomitus squalens LYAD-421 SS1]EJF67484.1 hypothetical protein DICSQDRAFT_143000 [Dichomitus squalens LYAD-421 SS1]TBU40708.1 hypothetical protein BD309DRAFT_992892 [Dichomitus squalens]TBU53580.1 hypothetical protein BD310DRAFT_829830 [Dichomitus squalens]